MKLLLKQLNSLSGAGSVCKSCSWTFKITNGC